MKTAVDNLYMYDPQFEAGAKTFVSEAGGSSATRPIMSASDVGNCIKEFSLVKFLVFDTLSAVFFILPDRRLQRP